MLKHPIAACAFGIFTASTIAPAVADDDYRFPGFSHSTAPACERSADAMLRACLFGLGESQQSTIANCFNIEDDEERTDCAAESRSDRGDSLDECFAVYEARHDACEILDEDRYADPLETVASFVDPDDVTASGVPYAPNPYVSIVAGHTYVLSAGEDGNETVVVHVTNDVREILGVDCRVVKDLVFERDGDEHVLVEYTDDWFAQDTNGNVYYCGEISRNYEDGVLRDLEGSFEAGLDFAKGGELILRFPAAGKAHRQEYALGNAEDIAQYLAIDAYPDEDEGGENGNDAAFACEPAGGCLKTLEFSPLEPESSEFKYYRAGVGFVLAVGFEDGEASEEREELVCTGTSLDVLASCVVDEEGTTAAEALAEHLCALDPGSFASLCP